MRKRRNNKKLKMLGCYHKEVFALGMFISLIIYYFSDILGQALRKDNT